MGGWLALRPDFQLISLFEHPFDFFIWTPFCCILGQMRPNFFIWCLYLNTLLLRFESKETHKVTLLKIQKCTTGSAREVWHCWGTHDHSSRNHCHTKNSGRPFQERLERRKNCLSKCYSLFYRSSKGSRKSKQALSYIRTITSNFDWIRVRGWIRVVLWATFVSSTISAIALSCWKYDVDLL